MRTPAAAFLLLATLPAAFAEEPKPDLVPSGLRPLIVREPKKSNEVTVVLDPPSSKPMTPPASGENEEPPGLIENLDSLPPAEGGNAAPQPAPQPAPAPEEEAVIKETPPAPPDTPKKQGVIVRVEKLQTASGPVDAADVKLIAPFLAKPLSATPKGWKLETVSTAPSFNREVEISPGSKITLNIRPHVLIPDTDGATAFPVTEPGFDSALGYQQTETVGAILADSLHQMENDSKRMGDAIERLQQLLVSLPKPPAPEPSIENAPVAKPVKLR